MMRCRPTNLIRQLDWRQILLLDQTFALRAVDPRHYGAFPQSVRVPVTPAGSGLPYVQMVINAGNGDAYPTIRITPSTTLSRVELRNETYDLSWAIEGVIPGGSTLVGDMEAHATAANRSVITIDSQTKYGMWRQPRDTFLIRPGANNLTLTTVPAGAPVVASVDFRDTWAG